MKRTLIDRLPEYLPDEYLALSEGVNVYDSSCSPEARVYYIECEGGMFLKVGKKETLRREAELHSYFSTLALTSEILSYRSDNYDYMLTRRVRGEDCTHQDYLQDPKKLCDTLALRLRMLHETPASGCPVQDRMSSYLGLANENHRTGNYDKSHFPDSFGYKNEAEAFATMQHAKEVLTSRVLLHGDYCLPNILLDHWNFSGFIDLGGGGVGDRHIDLFWGVWTLEFNLHTDRYASRFLDAYGRDVIDEDALRIVGACEVFG